MNDISSALNLAVRMVLNFDRDLLRIVLLSLSVSLTAVGLAGLFGLPIGAALAVFAFRGRHTIIVLLNALLGLPPVVVGLFVYLMLSRAGPLGAFGILFTPGAMVFAQAILVAPIVTALVHRAVADRWASYGDSLRTDGATRLRAIPELRAMTRPGVLTAFLAGFGRAISEVGGNMIGGGNIAGVTRTMTTAITLETSEGNLPLALALGMILVSISIAVSALAFALARRGHPE